MKINNQTIWYVVVGKKAREREENYPLTIYCDKDVAELVARANNESVIPVKPYFENDI
jgi:hypothetical protein